MKPETVHRLFTLYEKQFGVSWMAAMAAVKSDLVLKELAALIEVGRVQEALTVVNRSVTNWFNSHWIPAFTESAAAAGLFIQRSIGVPIVLDQITNWRAVSTLQANGLRLVRGFSAQQSEAAIQAIQRAFTTGANPIATARAFRESIGLTPYQEQVIANYRTALETGSSNALNRALRDRRFDPTVRGAIEGRVPLKPEQIERMVGRYRERWLKYRSETIARTESLRAVHQGQNEMYQQAIEEGLLQPQQMEQEWNTAGDERVRESHAAMHGQVVAMEEPFITGQGNELMFPGDPSAPAEETVDCRCAVGTRIKEISLPAEFSA